MKTTIVFFVAVLAAGCSPKEKKAQKKASDISPSGIILFETRPLVPARYFDIGTILADGSEVSLLTTHEETDKINNSDAVFSPDGSRVVFCIDSGKVSLFKSELHVMDATDSDMDGFGDNQYTLTHLNQQAYGASWVATGSGSKIGFQNESESGIRFSVIYLNNDLETDSIIPRSAYKWEDMDFVFSPDGRKVLFLREVASEEGKQRSYVIYTRDEDGSNEKRLTLQDGYLRMYPAWSNDGKKIVYACNKADGENRHLYTMDATEGEYDEGSNQQLTFYGSSNVLPVFSPCGNYIAFSSDRDGTYDIFIMPVTGETPTEKAEKLTGTDTDDEFPSDWVMGGG